MIKAGVGMKAEFDNQAPYLNNIWLVSKSDNSSTLPLDTSVTYLFITQSISNH